MRSLKKIQDFNWIWTVHKQLIAPSKVIRVLECSKKNFFLWNLEPGKTLLVESGTLGFGILNTAQEIWDPANYWNWESKFHWQGIQNPVQSQNRKSRIQIDCLGLSYRGQVPRVTNINFLLKTLIDHFKKKLWEIFKWSTQKNALIFHQILSTNHWRNVWRSARRICMLI